MSVILLRLDRLIRAHPAVVAMFTVASVALVATGHLYGSSAFPLALTYVFPIALCTYAVGPVAGVVTAVVVAVIWLLDANVRGIGRDEVTTLVISRLFSNLVIVGLAWGACTAVRTREQYLQAQRSLDQLRADIVAAFSHDLRSPLSAILGYAQILGDESQSLGVEAAEMLDGIVRNATRLDALIGEMLTAGSDEGRPPLHIETVDPAAMISDLRAEFDQRSRGSDVALVWEVAPGTPPLSTDRTKAVSILRNLVSNALKFTQHGRVCARISYDEARRAHHLEVADTGPGIPAAALPRVFDRFYRAGQVGRTRGFGLGLFIVQRFTELLGGTIEVRSEEGQGTVFEVWLPQHQPGTLNA